jgi:hypothetical protein
VLGHELGIGKVEIAAGIDLIRVDIGTVCERRAFDNTINACAPQNSRTLPAGGSFTFVERALHNIPPIM